MTREQIQKLYSIRMNSYLTKKRRDKEDETERKRIAFQKKQDQNAKLSMLLQGLNMGKDLRELRQQKLLNIDAIDPNTGELITEAGKIVKKYKFKEDRTFKDFLKSPVKETGESIKRVLPKGELELTPEYEERVRDFELKKAGVAPVAPPGVPLAEEWAADEPLQKENYELIEDLPLTKPEYSPETIQELQRQADLYTPTVPAAPDYEKIQASADLTRGMQKETAGGIEAMSWRDISETSEKAPDISEGDPILQSMQEGWEAGADQAGQEAAPMLASAGAMTDAPLDMPDSDPGMIEKTGDLTGKAFKSLQTIDQMRKIGKVIGDDETTGEDKVIAGAQGVQLLADMAAKRAGQETVSEIGKKAASKFLKEGALTQGAKLGARQAIGTVAGGIMGGYKMASEAKAAKESWEEGDYDEAILQGIGSIGGGLQTAGAGLMVTGVGIPLGAVMYGLGTAADVISSTGQFIENLFGKDEPVVAEEPKKPKYNAARYIGYLRRGRDKKFAY